MFLVIGYLTGCLFLVTGCSKPEVPATKVTSPITKIAITTDLCPSSKPYEAKLFKYLSSLKAPIAVCVSGRWLERHEKELEAIKKLDLDITWVNHSYSHPVSDDFLNNPKVNFRYEVLHNVNVMRNHHLTVSKYFRFPGLRHKKQRLIELAKMGYVNLDADAWLGKGESIKNGSVILIHGNGNENKGVADKFINYLKANKVEIIPLDSLLSKKKGL
ncbi:MAG: polysaccharide deacetylase family protein [Candidatus Margulisbacteria bacterium]|nr:polysaccharide deacetylase family protein [Candidatus Margulisiibacteriota bacterium]